jgi:putative sterol carrier protein
MALKATLLAEPKGQAEGARTPPPIGLVLARLERAFRPESAEKIRVTYQLELSGEGGGEIWLEVAGNKLTTGQGHVERSDVTFRLSASDFCGLLEGSENPDLLFMAERLRVEGELSLALQLRKLFRTPI